MPRHRSSDVGRSSVRGDGMKKFATIAGLLLGSALVPAGLAWADATIHLPAEQIIESRQSGQDVIYAVIADMKAAVAAKADVKPFAVESVNVVPFVDVTPCVPDAVTAPDRVFATVSR